MPDQVSTTEVDLDRADMAALQGGEAAALDRLMERWQGPVTGFLERLTQDAFDAEDLAQETFVRVFRKRDAFDPRHKFSTWLFAIASNLARDRSRRRTLRQADPLEDHPEPESPAATPSENELQKERIQAVKRAVANLPEELRVALILAEYQEYSQEEIAATLKTTVKSVESRLYRARRQLRDALARWLKE